MKYYRIASIEYVTHKIGINILAFKFLAIKYFMLSAGSYVGLLYVTIQRSSN